MNSVSSTPTVLSSLNLQLMRNQLQNIIGNCREALSSIGKLKTMTSPPNEEIIERKLQQILVELVLNQDKYVIDKMLIPIVYEINRANNKSNDRLASTFYENRFGFTRQELLDAEYYDVNVSPSFGQRKNIIFNKNFNDDKSFQYISKRGFKTRRQLKDAEDEENYGLLKRVFNSMKSNETDKMSREGDLYAKQINSRNNRNLFEARNTNTVTSVDDNRIKIAFAEGYLANSSNKNKTSIFRRIHLYLSVTVLLFILIIILSQFISINKSDTPNGPSGIKFRVNMPGAGPTEVRVEDVKIRFTDVRGASEAKMELNDIVDYLRDPVKFTRLGAHLPKGVLLVGPPGVGKTLLAKAVAGEAGVPFFHASGSEFDEMFVGTGARKIRQLFQSARARAPCVIFIDEVDTVGAKRTDSPTHPYANQTINQLLAEMDGFEKNEGVIVLAATNRPQHLDKALTRPGRFDVQVSVDPPDYKGRLEVLDLYLKKIVQGEDIDIELIARKTTGFTGAELENLVNQAALKAALGDEDEVSMKHIEWSLEKVNLK